MPMQPISVPLAAVIAIGCNLIGFGFGYQSGLHAAPPVQAIAPAPDPGLAQPPTVYGVPAATHVEVYHEQAPLLLIHDPAMHTHTILERRTAIAGPTRPMLAPAPTPAAPRTFRVQGDGLGREERAIRTSLRGEGHDAATVNATVKDMKASGLIAPAARPARTYTNTAPASTGRSSGSRRKR